MFKNKKVLVTAGPTWTAVDRVRVMTSIFSGETGLRFARHFKDLGAEVTLLMGPGRAKFLAADWAEMNIKQFFYYDDLADMLSEELELNKFDIIIHSSAVSDYKTANANSGKTPSGMDLTLNLEPTAKLVDRIRAVSPDSFLVKFKLQVGLTPEELFEIAFSSLKSTGADLIVANDLDTMDGENHLAYIIDPQGRSRKVTTKDSMCRGLEEEIRKRLE